MSAVHVTGRTTSNRWRGLLAAAVVAVLGWAVAACSYYEDYAPPGTIRMSPVRNTLPPGLAELEVASGRTAPFNSSEARADYFVLQGPALGDRLATWMACLREGGEVDDIRDDISRLLFRQLDGSSSVAAVEWRRFELRDEILAASLAPDIDPQHSEDYWVLEIAVADISGDPCEFAPSRPVQP